MTRGRCDWLGLHRRETLISYSIPVLTGAIGREPQGEQGKRMKAPEGGDRSFLWRERQASTRYICRPSAAFSLFFIRILGPTPQAMYLSPLRGSRSHDNFSSGLDQGPNLDPRPLSWGGQVVEDSEFRILR
jgi:hypothetical protein